MCVLNPFRGDGAFGPRSFLFLPGYLAAPRLVNATSGVVVPELDMFGHPGCPRQQPRASPKTINTVGEQSRLSPSRTTGEAGVQRFRAHGDAVPCARIFKMGHDSLASTLDLSGRPASQPPTNYFKGFADPRIKAGGSAT